MAHIHTKQCKNTSTDQDIQKIAKVLVVVFLFMLLELWGHHESNSLSLLADSIHLLVDFLGFLVSLVALKWTQKKPTKKMSFGYSRIEILGAIFSIFLIWVATGYLFLKSYQKLTNPKKIKGEVFLTISVVGLFVNLYCLYALHSPIELQGEHRNLNIRAAYIHVIGDLIQSIGVVLASILLYINPRWVIVDLICTLCFSLLVLCSTFYIIRDALRILIERVPADCDFESLQNELMGVPNVTSVISLHAWNISANVKAVNACLLLTEIWKYETSLMRAKEILYDKFGFSFVCIQFETSKTAEFIPSRNIEEDFRCSIPENQEKIEKVVLKCVNLR